MLSKHLCLTPFLWGIVQCLLAQGPISGFMPSDGQVDVAFTYSQERYDAFHGSDGQRVPRELNARSYNLFLEYGNSRTALVASLPYIHHDDDNRGWQDASLWVKYRNERTEKAQGFHNLITAVGLGFPVSRYPSDNVLAIGRQAATFNGRFLWQYDAKYGWFIHLQSGVDFQFAPTAQAAIPVLLRGGLGTARYYVDGWIERYQSLDNAGDSNNLSVGTGSSWTRIGGTLYVPLRPWVGIFTGGAWVLGGRNIGRSSRLNVGMVLRKF